MTPPPNPVIDPTPVTPEGLYQSLIAAARFAGALIIATLVSAIPQLVGFFMLGPIGSSVAIVLLGMALAFLGKLLRGPSIPIPTGQIVAGGMDKIPEQRRARPSLVKYLPF